MMTQKLGNSYLFGGNAPFVEELYETYLADPSSVPEAWRSYFDQLQDMPGASARDVAHAPVVNAFSQLARENRLHQPAGTSIAGAERKQVAVLQLINAYRFLGNRHANLDPLKRLERPPQPELDPGFHGLTEADMGTVFNTGSFVFGAEQATLREIIEALRQTYCGTIAAEYMYISDNTQKRWIQQRLEWSRATPNYTNEQKKNILDRLTAAETLERYLHTRYVGQKRFSLEGGESTIVCLDEIVRVSGSHGAQDIVIGMAHRGRLNVLVNTLGKAPQMLFSEFEGKAAADLSAGDVKYHMGFSSDVATPGGPVHLTLAFNPSHLEIVNPVVAGSVYARQVRRNDTEKTQVIPIIIHGDSAVAGQGVNQEMLNFSQTRGYGTGGTIHIVVNNQIGFTTSDLRDLRSTLYCTDIFKMVESPVFHVNGDDPEAVAFVTQMAVEFRQQFKKDVVIDIVCFRKLGHNEQDEPMVTQPMMYKKISQHPGTRQLYVNRLQSQGVLAEGEGDQMIKDFRVALDEGRHVKDPVLANHKAAFATDWSPYVGHAYTDDCDSGVPVNELKRLSERLTAVPEGFVLHSRVKKIVDDRRKMGAGEQPVDWGMAENLAYATLLAQGYNIRLSGEDCGRSTFFHRHAVWHDQKREQWNQGTHTPLTQLQDKQGQYVVIDSILSEEAVLAFEYGYSTTEPDWLTIWEAQFGDFANGAQVVIDQFISSGEAKWGRLCGLVMMLPHGYEGQGPEHSSARLERYMQLCAEQNMQVCVPTTPSQIYHLLRRQMVRKVRKPLVIMTPKSLLRHKDAVSSLDELTKGTYRTVIGEVEALDAKKVERVLLCSGKVYYDLVSSRRERERDDVAIVRLEQLFPFPADTFAEEMAKYPNAKEVVWCQEEPRNQGAWYWFASRHHLERALHPDQTLFYAGRPSAASPAVGYYALHNQQLKQLLDDAFGEFKKA